jgi:hypothetical protein
LILKTNKNNEHITNLNESVQTMISLHTNKNAIFNSANLNKVRVDQLDVSNNLIVNKGTFNTVKVNNNLDISNNITASSGNIGNLTVTNLTGTNSSLRNVRSSDISSNNIFAESGTFRNVTSESVSIPRYNIATLNASKICFDPTDTTKCLTMDSLKGLQNLNNYNVNNPKNQYMYYPNTIPGDMNATIPATYDNNIVWTELNKYIDLNNSLNADLGKLRAIGSGESWLTASIISAPLAYTGQANPLPLFRTSTFKNAQPKGTGIEITIPKPPANNPNGDYSVLWIRCSNSNAYWYTFKLYEYNASTDTIVKSFGKFADGFSQLNKISPDGSTHNTAWNTHQWIAIPFDLSGNTSRKLVLSNFWSNNDNNPYINSMAFSINPWNHCKVAAVAIFWQVNNDDNSQGKTDATAGFSWETHDWNNEQLARFHGNNNFVFRIPFVNSGKDKIFYIVEHNNNWGPGIAGLSIFKNNAGTEVENQLGNLYTSLDNPFARHHNSKMYQRYYGIVIPKDFLPTKGLTSDNFIKLRITIPGGQNLYFREVGTHDKNSFE